MGMNLPLLAALGFFGATALVVLVVQDYLTEKRRTRATLRSIESTTSGQLIGNLREDELSAGRLGRLAVPALRRLAGFAKRFTPVEIYDRIRQDLVYAGSPPTWDAERIVALKIFLPVTLVPLALIALPLLGLPFIITGATAFLLGAVGYYGPEWIVRSRGDARQHEIQMALPDAIDLLAITVEAGLAFDAALSRVARNVGGPLGEELVRVVQEMQLGKGRGESLRDLGERSSVDDLRSFVLAMVQADVFGIPIVKVLTVQAREMRIRRRQRAEERAQKLPVKIVFPVVLCIFPSIFVVLLGPAGIQIYDAILR